MLPLQQLHLTAPALLPNGGCAQPGVATERINTAPARQVLPWSGPCGSPWQRGKAAIPENIPACLPSAPY